ncbi:hypothetical protein DHD05_18135 [Arenibacter sp. N53]|uniref:HYC_CC_PP family protein n=1 Tax=Arenibacter TaxID=178469 RepID=UPI000CD443D0|nr:MULTISPECIES: hypothetical protein [Arenibacter]MCM4153517.1 hypothetical protein [Arenibacter sp. N53]
MKKVFHKVLAVSMAFVVMFTTMSFTMDMHYCGSSLVDLSFYSSADSCGMEIEQPLQDCETNITSKSCCTEHQLVKEANQDLKISLDKLTFEQQTFVATFLYSYINLFESFDENIQSFKDYSPPFLKRDVQVLYELYLI